MKQTRELLAKQMTRKEFLQLVGVGILTVFGVMNFLSFFRVHTGQSQETALQQPSRGFGSSKFGV